MKMQRNSADGTAFLHRTGTGPTLVLLHGIGSQAESWSALIASLPEHVPVLAWDAPGYGNSTPLKSFAPTPMDYAARLAALLTQDRLVLVGHSLGALFAGVFARRWPARVAALAFLSPALGYAVPPDTALPPAMQARIDDLERLGPVAFAQARAARLMFRPEANPALLARIRTAMGSVHTAGYAQAVRSLGAGDLLADAAPIATPALVAVGAEDFVTPPANAARLHAALSHGLGAPRILPACGHALPQEAPEATAALLEELLAHVG